MVIYKGGIGVEKGLYWDPMDGNRVNMEYGGILPGDESKFYLKISPLGLLVLSPLFGMMYVIFLPLFGIGVFIVSWLVIIINSVAKMAMSGIQICSRIAGKRAFFNWSPYSSYLSGRRRDKKAGRRIKRES